MHCPTCGHPADADDYWCERCATRLVRDPLLEAEPEPEPEPQPVLVPAATLPPPKVRYVPPPPPSAPPIPVVPRPAPAPSALSVFSRNLGVSKWWPLFVPGLIVVAILVAMTSGSEDRPDTSTVRSGLYTAPSGSFEVRIPHTEAKQQKTGVRITDQLSAIGVASILGNGSDKYRITEVESPDPERPRGIDHCLSNGPTARASEGTVDDHVATFCHWRDRNRFYGEAFVLRGSRVFLIEHSSYTEDDDPFRALVAGFAFMD